MASGVYGCDQCGRLLAEWVVESGLTLNHQGKNYCRLCYAELRQAGRVKPHKDDQKLIRTVSKEHGQLPSESGVVQIRKTPGETWVEANCPSCRRPIRAQLRSRSKVAAACMGCRAHLEITPSGVSWVRTARLGIVNNIASRLGMQPRDVDNVLKFFFDEVAAQMAEGRYMTFREFGSLRVLPDDGPKGIKVDFSPSKFLIDSVKERRVRRG